MFLWDLLQRWEGFGCVLWLCKCSYSLRRNDIVYNRYVGSECMSIELKTWKISSYLETTWYFSSNREIEMFQPIYFFIFPFLLLGLFCTCSSSLFLMNHLPPNPNIKLSLLFQHQKVASSTGCYNNTYVWKAPISNLLHTQHTNNHFYAHLPKT